MASRVKCLKIFFKHTWHPQQMIVVPSPASIWDYPHLDQLTYIIMMGSIYEAAPNPKTQYFPSEVKTRIPSDHSIEGKMDGVVNYKAGETEFGEIKIIVPSSSLDPGPVTAATTTTTTDGSMVPCRSGVCKSGRDRTELRPESPWHGLKTIFLVTVIVALVLWVIVYALLAQYEIL